MMYWEYDTLSADWEYHTLSASCWEYDSLTTVCSYYYANRVAAIILSAWCAESMILSKRAEKIILSAHQTDRMILSAPFGHAIMLTAAATKNNKQQCWWLPIYNFGQQRLNGTSNWSAAKGGQVLPHFKHIVSGASMPPCPIAALF